MLNRTQQTLFKLLRIALGQEKDLSWNSEADLKDLIALAKSQGVSCVACDGLKQLYERAETDNLVAKSLQSLNSDDCELLKFNWLGETMKAERSYKQYVQEILKLASFLSSHGIRTMVLKGYGLSLNYPNPAHRLIGDIDVYLFGQAEEANRLVKRELDIDLLPNEIHHSVFPWGNYMVENHHFILNIYKHPSNKRLEKILEALAEGATPIATDGVTLYLPSVKFNSIHILRHMASDFATVTTTLRHILDWCTFVQANAESMDWPFLQKVAKESKMNRFLDALNCICVDYLGCRSELFPVENRDDELSKSVLGEIFSPTFQEKIPSSSNIILYGWKKAKRMLQNRWKYEIVFDESLLASLLSSVKNRINKTLKCFTK